MAHTVEHKEERTSPWPCLPQSPPFPPLLPSHLFLLALLVGQAAFSWQKKMLPKAKNLPLAGEAQKLRTPKKFGWCLVPKFF